ncbi:EEV glycoprotein-like protein [Seal parapoxvirus]|uniref:EEV glycoprotein-like protein n=1 Tax=Seal parapoxvirus TaxID=187984 RepID=A0A1Z3GCQ4_9POXV|nr:EEV glycoprotein-like protein [Seal parapoxvirus]ASC55539.1 EEV glycoprotein-like protein [Seal parapoxvirus]
MGCCKSPNRQCARTLKRASCSAASLVSILSVLTSLGAIVKYTDFFLKEACEQDWIPIKDVCVLNTQFETDVVTARGICEAVNGELPATTNTLFLKGIMSIVEETSFWMAHHDSYKTVNIPKGNGRFDTTVPYNQTQHTCLVNLFGLMYHDCTQNTTAVCVKKMYTHK